MFGLPQYTRNICSLSIPFPKFPKSLCTDFGIISLPLSMSILSDDRLLTIRKVDHRGQLITSYPAWLLDDRATVIALARWQRPTLHMPYVSFAYGDLLFETFHLDRPYNVFALHDGNRLASDIDLGLLMRAFGQGACTVVDVLRLLPEPAPLKGCYINFTAPVQYDAATRTLVWRDVCLDLWAPVHGQPLLLDEDEYIALDLPASDPDLHRSIHDALADLWPRALAHRTPFDDPFPALTQAGTTGARDQV